MNGYFVSITNNLLEDKHYERMGNAVWLYMWLIDRMTEISEGQGIVNNGLPVTYELVKQRFTTMPLRTYRRMIATLRDAGYVNTTQTQYGLYITINKPKKQFNKKAVAVAKNGESVSSRSAKNGTPEPSRSAKTRNSGVPKSVVSSAKNGTPLYMINNAVTKTSDNDFNKLKSGEAENDEIKMVGVLYYQAIKALDLPVRNHNNINKKIKELEKSNNLPKVLRYLEFVRDQYSDIVMEYKPQLTEGLDIFLKRIKIEEAMKRTVMESRKPKTGYVE